MIKKALHPPFLPASPPYAETFRMNRFSYRSLYEEASLSLDSAVKSIFESYGTQDFEFVLRLQWTAHHVNATLSVRDFKVVVEAYNGVKDALIRTVHRIHVSY